MKRKYKYYRVESEDGYVAVNAIFRTKKEAQQYIKECEKDKNNKGYDGKRKWSIRELSLKQYIKSTMNDDSIPDDTGKSNSQIVEELEELERQEKKLGHKPKPFSELLKELNITEEDLK